YFALPPGSAQSIAYDAVGVGSALAIAAGVRLNRPSSGLPWLFFALGNLSFAVADIIFNILVDPPVPSVADWFYLGGYPLLAAGLCFMLLADEIYGVASASYASGDWIDAGWLLSYVLWGAAALHPSMRELSLPRERGQPRVGLLRLGLLVAALVTAPVVL